MSRARELTIDDLKQMDGQKVWVENSILPGKFGGWHKVHLLGKKLIDDAGNYWSFDSIERKSCKVYDRNPGGPEFKVGDKVRIRNSRGAHWNDDGKMDKYMGKVVTITAIADGCIDIEEDQGDPFNGGGWTWDESDFVAIESPKWLHDFLHGKFAINCRTEDQAKELMSLLEKHDVKWYSGSKLSRLTNWEENSSNTAYICTKSVNHGFLLTYGGADYPVLKDIREYASLDKKEQEKQYLTTTEMIEFMFANHGYIAKPQGINGYVGFMGVEKSHRHSLSWFEDNGERLCSFIVNRENMQRLWEISKEQKPVTWQEAIEIWAKERKTVEAIFDEKTYVFEGTQAFMHDNEGDPIGMELITEGTWYIID